MKKIFSILLNLLIAGIIIFWAYLLYKDFAQLSANTVQTSYLFFTVKVLMFCLFLIASISLAVFLNLIQVNTSYQQDSSLPVVSNLQSDEELSELEVIRKILTEKLQVLDQIWEQSIHSEDKEQRNDGEETLLDLLDAQNELLKPENLNDLIRQLVETVAKFTASKRVSLFLYDSENQKMRMVYGKGFAEQNVSIDIEGTIDGYVFRNGKRIFVTNIETHPELGRDNKPQYKSKSFIVFPIKLSDQKTIGVFNLTEKEGIGMYSMTDLEKINLLLNQFLLKMEVFIQKKEKSIANPIKLI